jgi:hypothetical protein
MAMESPVKNLLAVSPLAGWLGTTAAAGAKRWEMFTLTDANPS